MFEVPLTPGPSGPRSALLREPRGLEEALFTRRDSVFASELVGKLLLHRDQRSTSESDVWGLSIADRDRLVAELYLQCYGDRVDAVVPCGSCRGTFSIDFSLTALLARRDEPSVDELAVEGPDPTGAYRLSDGTRFRVPTAGDERALAGGSSRGSVQGLLERCVLSGNLESCAERVQEAMGVVAPLLSTELQTTCAMCGQAQPVRFDVVGFFMSALISERPLLFREVHCLARAYGWSRREILSLTRTERRCYVALVLAESEARRGGAAS